MSASPAPNSSSAPSALPALSPSYRLPWVIIAIALLALTCQFALPTVLLQPWVSLIVALLGVFLLFQTTVIRLVFEAQALVVYRNQTVLRRFPYQDWQSWSIFWAPVPILFYFREVKSIHFLPILFSPRELRQQLETHLADLEKAAPATTTP
ncbi:MAG: DUF3119 family protein [Cyanobacteria bacterium P01_D01_bin.44]